MGTCHEDSDPARRLEEILNTAAIGTTPKPAVLQLIQRIRLTYGRLTIRVDGRLTARHRSLRKFPSVDASHKGTLHGRLNPSESCMLSHLDEVGADVRLRARFADLADEDVDSAEGDPLPVLN